MDLLDLEIQQPAPVQPSALGGGDLGAGLLDLLGATAHPASGWSIALHSVLCVVAC